MSAVESTKAGTTALHSPGRPGGMLMRDVKRVSISDVTPVHELQALVSGNLDGFGVIGCSCGQDHSLAQVSREFNFPPGLKDALLESGKRPKLETFGDSYLLLVTRATLDEDGLISIQPVQVVCHGKWMVVFEDPNDSATAWHPVEDGGEFVMGETQTILAAILDASIKSYMQVLDGIEESFDEAEAGIFSGTGEGSEVIYRLGTQVSALKSSLSGLSRFFDQIPDPRGVPSTEWRAGIQEQASDVADILARTIDVHHQLAQLVTINATLIARRQNEDMKRISSWAAILFAPTLIGAIYGMNFAYMPELDWKWGYPIAIAAMVLVGVVLYWVFRRQRWL